MLLSEGDPGCGLQPADILPSRDAFLKSSPDYA
jgi:hypothetical protein